MKKIKSLFEEIEPMVIPEKPKTKPKRKISPIPKPREDDPFNVPAPKISPKPKAWMI